MSRNTKQPTKKALNAAYAVVRAYNEAEEVKRAATLRPLVGKFYKYRNSYGGDREKWWLYAAVTGLDGTWLKGWVFEDDHDGEIRIKLKEMMHVEGNSGYIEIPAQEFWAAAAKLAEKLHSRLTPPLSEAPRDR